MDLGYCGIPQNCEWEDTTKNVPGDGRPGKRISVLLEEAWIQEVGLHEHQYQLGPVVVSTAAKLLGRVGILCTNTPAFLESIFGIGGASAVNVGELCITLCNH